MASLALPLPEPPTSTTIADARAQLVLYEDAAKSLERKLQDAKEALARLLEEKQNDIREIEKELAGIEDKVTAAKAYISPIKRLPHELLRHVFMFTHDDCPWSGWVLSAVCMIWRRLALSMPTLWSKIRLVTTQTSSAETIRLWLERSGRTVPLDIEIVIRSPTLHAGAVDALTRRRAPPFTTPAGGDHWATGGGGWTTPPPLVHTGTATATAVHLQLGTHPTLHVLPAQAVLVPDPGGAAPPSPAHTPEYGPWDIPPVSASERTPAAPQRLKKNMHWGHIAFYYLVEQIHRWERFVFRFDKQFASVGALKSVEGDAPLLREFEISCTDPAFYGDWKWLPSAPVNSQWNMASLQTLTLQHVPFKWSSPMLRGLRSLSLRSLPTMHIQLDRILHIIAGNPQLETLTINFASPNPPVLPLTPVTLRHLKALNVGGHYLLSTLVESLVLPELETLVLDIDAREPMEDTVSSLISRSGNPPVTRLSLAYGVNTGPQAGFYWGTGAGVASWHFLGELDQLESLQVGSAPLEPLVTTLSAPDEDNGHDHWVCPNLTSLAMHGCHAHSDGIPKLVQMVEGRNPDAGTGGTVFGGVTPARMKQLELYECSTLGPDVLMWLKRKVDEVICTEPTFESARYVTAEGVQW